MSGMWVLAYDPDEGGTEILCVTPDEDGVMPLLAGAMLAITKTEIEASRFGLVPGEDATTRILTVDKWMLPDFRAIWAEQM